MLEEPKLRVRLDPDGSRYEIIADTVSLSALIARAYGKVIAVDTETSGLSVVESRIVGFSICFEEGSAFYIPLNHPESDNIPAYKAYEICKPLLEESKVVCHNWVFDSNMFLHEGIKLGYHADTMVLAYIDYINSNNNLKEVSRQYLGKDPGEFVELFPPRTKAAKKTALALTAYQIFPYACRQTDYTLRIYNILYEKVKTEFASIWRVERALVPANAEHTRRGVPVDPSYFDRFIVEMDDSIAGREQDCWEVMGEEVPLGSSAKVAPVLFEKFEVPVIGKTKTGRPSTDQKFLIPLEDDYPVVHSLLEYRRAVKLRSMAVRLVKEIHTGNKRIYCGWLQCNRGTGRFACASPNLQQLPEVLRYGFPAPPGRYLLDGDYKTIEMRTAATITRCHRLIELFKSGMDVHKATASLMLEVPHDEVTEEQRDLAKTINFGIIYGMDAIGLARRLKIPRDKAQYLLDRYFAGLPGLKEGIDACVDKARKCGYTTTYFGRRRYVPELESDNWKIRERAERNCFNNESQGSAADILKIALVKSYRHLKGVDWIDLVLHVHDDILWAVDESVPVSQAIDFVRDCMIFDIPGHVPIEVGFKIGWSWGDLVKIDEEELLPSMHAESLISSLGKGPKPSDRPSKAVTEEELIIDTVEDVETPSTGSVDDKKVILFFGSRLSQKECFFLKKLIGKNPGSYNVIIDMGGEKISLPDHLMVDKNREVVHYLHRLRHGGVAISWRSGDIEEAGIVDGEGVEW